LGQIRKQEHTFITGSIDMSDVRWSIISCNSLDPLNDFLGASDV
jgi:hypothetical protein